MFEAEFANRLNAADMFGLMSAGAVVAAGGTAVGAVIRHTSVQAGSIANTGNRVLGAGNRLPNFENARIDSMKFYGYSLNPNHVTGGNKARVFERALGYNQSNADQLISQIRRNLPNNNAVIGLRDNYGQRFTVDMQIRGVNGNTATVRTGWIIDVDSSIPRLVTIYVR